MTRSATHLRHTAPALVGRTLQLLALALPLALAQPCAAQGDQQGRAFNRSTHADRANSGTIGIISGGADGTYIRIAADLANVLDGSELRILPIVGRGSLQNLRDIMFLRGTDIGIVQMDAREGLTADGLREESINRLRYIARLYNEEIHVLASREIKDIRALSGKKVNIDKSGSGTNLTARLVFEKIGVTPEFTTFDQASSYEKLRSGEIQAAIYVAGRPVRAITEFQADGRFHLLAVPFEGDIADAYFPAKFTQADYPHLVGQGKDIDTIAVGSILAVFNWPEGSIRYKRVERFVDAFFSRFDEFLLPGRHPKWKEVSLTADVPGWTRNKAAQNWIDSSAKVATASAEGFGDLLDGQGLPASAKTRERLFQEFLTWYRNRPGMQTGAAR